MTEKTLDGVTTKEWEEIIKNYDVYFSHYYKYTFSFRDERI